ncbi:MAG: hypothetical protein HFI72_02230 [Peptococcaceae bacterium]|nr:hypothetical protein [Peptococcaceae bacterium]
MKIFYFKKNLGKIIPLCCLIVMACWGIYGAYLDEPLSLRAGAAMEDTIEEGASIALKIDDNGKVSGEAVMKLAKDLKAKRLTNVNLFFTKAWVQKYPEAYTFVAKKGIETGVWWHDKETMQEKPVEIETANVYLMQTSEMMSKLAGENVTLYLASERYSREEQENIAAQVTCQGVSAKEKLEGMRTEDKLTRVEATAEIGMLYCDVVNTNTVAELEQIREVLHSKNIELVKISKNKPLCNIEKQQVNQEKGDNNEQNKK